MCGIFCLISSNSDSNCSKLYTDFQLLECLLRNRGPDYTNMVYSTYNQHNLIFFASVLWLQGKQMVEQPIENTKSVFLYNGDVFGGTEISSEQRQTRGDTVCFLEVLEDSSCVSRTLENIQGPYAFVYLNKQNGKLYFGRDKYGRRSLLIGKDNDNVILTSTSKRNTAYRYIELPAIGTFCYNVQTKSYSVLPWSYKNRNFETELNKVRTFLNVDDIQVIEEISKLCYTSFREPCNEDLAKMIELKNMEKTAALASLLNDKQWQQNVLKLNSLLENAVEKRISTQPPHCKHCILTNTVCTHSITGILFSGGVDCAILALLAHKFTDNSHSLDLINVAFDKVENYETPDRISGRQTLEELKRLCPERKWNFVEVNVTEKELNEKRREHIADLVFPLNTVLDDSLGCALWFAGRGQTEHHDSSCRVLLVGMGADELFGGYTKHRTAFNRKGWLGLYSALDEDWENLPHRNLARDDRVISDHGRQLRTPYLDEDVVEFVKNLNCWKKTFPSADLKEGLGEKIVLRSLAYHLGLKNAAVLKKKALQFGSKIANSKENAQHVSHRLLEVPQ